MIGKSIGRAATAVLLSVACSSENSRIQQPAPTASSSTSGSANASSTPLAITVAPSDWADSIQAAEVASIKTSEGKAVRSAGELRIQLLNGEATVFHDDTTEGGSFSLYRYAGYLKSIHSHVVHRVPYEGTGIFYVVDDSTGDSTTVAGMPVPSPGGARFAITSQSGQADYDESLIEVWRVAGRSVENEFSYDAGKDSWNPDEAVWRDSATVDFMKVSRDPALDYKKTPARLIRTGSEWVFSEPEVDR